MLRHALRLLVWGAALAGCASAPPRVVYVQAEPYPEPVVYAAPAPVAYAAPPVVYGHPVRPGGIYGSGRGAHEGPRSIYARPRGVYARPPVPVPPQAAQPTPRAVTPVGRPVPLQRPPHYATRPRHQPTRNHGWHKHAELEQNRETAER